MRRGLVGKGKGVVYLMLLGVQLILAYSCKPRDAGWIFLFTPHTRISSLVLSTILLAIHFNPTSSEVRHQGNRRFIFRKQCENQCAGAGESCREIKQEGYKWECSEGTDNQKGEIEIPKETKEDCFEFDCDYEERWLCPSVKRTWIKDKKVPTPYPNRALHTIPDRFIVKTSSIPDAGLGVWALTNVSECVVFGPFGGEKIYDVEDSTLDYAYLIRNDDDEMRYLVDAYNPATSNWMRYINCALTEESATLEAVQYKGEMYFQTRRAIPAGTEILIWYGDAYARYLGLL